MTAPIKIGDVDIVAPPGCTVAPNASPPPVEPMSPALAESAQHWHMKSSEAEAALARVTAERDGFVAMLAEAADERIEAKAAATQVTALQEAAAENGRLRAECTRLRKVATGYATIPRERAAMGRVGEVLARNGCDCDCGHDSEGHDSDCDRCLACLVQDALGGTP